MMSAVIDTKAKAWSPAFPIKTPDNIVSSQFVSQKVFVPSYEKEKRPCIEQLLTNEYQRIWWEEKEIWDKRYSRKTATKKLLLRGAVKRKPRNVPSYPAEIPKPDKKSKPKKKAEKATETEDAKKVEAKATDCDEKSEAVTQTDAIQVDKEV
ncbi:uncharacterized protein LOC113465205 [Ceratina calcarata]|uniref:Uncharacterized protein LOC113465205 n=1 Tax=Ceratina calcarata TaxID=156304 RepID=A0AAJ7SCA5_9HYME|nr:uncharacterized protein LOC113465205 [Ceratina calcarata]